MASYGLITHGLVILITTTISSIYVTGFGDLQVAPSGQQIKRVGRGAIFTCSLEDSGSDPPELRWKSPSGTAITSTKGRVYVEEIGSMALRLYITNIREDDAGLYSCEADLPGTDQTLFVDTTLSIFGAENMTVNITEAEIAFTDMDTLIEGSVGDDVLLPCVATGQPEPRVSWRHNRHKIHNDPDDKKLQYESGGLRIRNIQRSDNGTYECRAEVESQGNLKVRIISLHIKYPPEIEEGPKSATVVEGDEITLTCKAKGNPHVTYEWFREQKMNRIKIKVRLDSESEKYTIKSMKSTDIGRYFCKVSNVLGQEEAHADLDMMIPPRIRDLPHKVVLEGRTVIMPCEATGDPKPIITWTRLPPEGSSQREHEFLDGIQPNDGRVSVDSSQPGITKLVVHDIKRSFTGSYRCTAKSEAGDDSKVGRLTVEFMPTVNTTDTKKLAWPGQVRNFTCEGYGLPLPSMNWFRGGQYISNSDVYTIVNKRGNIVVSTLQIDLSKKNNLPWVYGQYSCIAKNQYGYITKTVNLIEAKSPDMPQNVTVLSETPTTVTFSAAEPAQDGGMEVTSWRLRYHEVDEEDQQITELYEEVKRVTIKDLKGGKTYMFYLSAGNIVGYGKASKFKIKTPKRAPREQIPADVPAKTPDPVQPEANYTYVDATKGKKADSKQEAISTPETGLSMFIAIGATAVVACSVLLAVIILLAMRRRKARIPDHKFYNGHTGGNALTVSVHGKEVDNIQLQIRDPAAPPEPAFPHKSPQEHRRHLVKTAGSQPSLDPQQVAWDQMLLRQAIEDEEEEEINQGPHTGDDLPPPPDFLLQDGEVQDDDRGSYHDVLDGYHSEDNMDLDMDGQFQIELPGSVSNMPNMYGKAL